MTSLFPQLAGKPDGEALAIEALYDAEVHRRSGPDKVSGAFHRLALTDGNLLKEDFDLSTHAHHSGWTIDVVVVDPVELTLINMRYDFSVGDRVLRELTAGLKVHAPRAKVVRVHSDGFAVIFGPTADQPVDDALISRMKEEVLTRIEKLLPDDGEPKQKLALTTGWLKLTVVQPSHWQVLGPLVWAESERALVLARRVPWRGPHARKIVLDAGLPEEALTGR